MTEERSEQDYRDIYEKVKINRRAELVRFAEEYGLT